MPQNNENAEDIQLEEFDRRFGFDFQLFVPKNGISLDTILEQKKPLADAS